MVNIKEVREQANLTRKQLSERYGIPLTTIQYWESCKRTPPEYVMNLLLRCIEVDFGINIKDTADEGTTKTFTLTYADDRPLSLADEMYVRTEK